MRPHVTRRDALKLGLAASLLPSAAFAAPSPVLIELFTSQGCSDCPPADKLAGALMREPGIFVVSMNVDYWDYLGWKDTLGQAQWSKRQAQYARLRGDGEIYTPQMVINGTLHAVGSNRGAVEAAVAEVRKTPMSVPISLSQGGDEIRISVGAGSGRGEVVLLRLTPEVSVPIARGENKGATITYHNVARKLSVLGVWDGKEQVCTAGRTPGDPSQLLAFLQDSETGAILGLSAFTLS